MKSRSRALRLTFNMTSLQREQVATCDLRLRAEAGSRRVEWLANN